MKNLITLLFISFSVTLMSCGGKKETTAKVPGMMELDLTSHGLPITITIPDSSKGKVEVVDQSWGATEIKVGKEFQVSISEGEGDISLAKSDVKNNDVNKFQKYIVEEPTAILYESKITEQPEHHFYTVVKAGAKSFVIEDIKGELFSEQLAKNMLESAKAIKEKVPAPKS